MSVNSMKKILNLFIILERVNYASQFGHKETNLPNNMMSRKVIQAWVKCRQVNTLGTHQQVKFYLLLSAVHVTSPPDGEFSGQQISTALGEAVVTKQQTALTLFPLEPASCSQPCACLFSAKSLIYIDTSKSNHFAGKTQKTPIVTFTSSLF